MLMDNQLLEYIGNHCTRKILRSPNITYLIKLSTKNVFLSTYCYELCKTLGGYYSWEICLFRLLKKAFNIFTGGFSCYTDFIVNEALFDVMSLYKNS